MADDFLYISHSTIEMKNGRRHAYMGDDHVPVIYGVQGALKERSHAPVDAPPIAITLDHIVAVVGG